MKSSSSISALLKKTFLDPVLEPTQSDPGIELRRCHMSSSANDHVVQQLKDSLDTIRLSCARRAKERETPLFCDELQDQLLDVTFSFTEDRDVWTKVWSPTCCHVQDDAIFVYRGQLALEDSKDLPLSTCFLQEPLPKKLGASTMQRLSSYVHQGVLGALRLPFRRLNNYRIGA